MYRMETDADFTLDMPNPKVKLRNIRIFVTPTNWVARLLWRWVRTGLIKCTWDEEPFTGKE